jgi:hypothetical protein
MGFEGRGRLSSYLSEFDSSVIILIIQGILLQSLNPDSGTHPKDHS